MPLKFAPIRSLRPDLSPAVDAVLQKALKLHADERYGTAQEMWEALESSGAAAAAANANAAGAGAGVSQTPANAAQSLVGSIPPPAKAAPAAQAKAVKSGASPAPSLPPTMTNPTDGADMILIPAGEFLMGSPAGTGRDDERPQHKVYLDAFYICKYQVTNGQFARFVEETGYKPAGNWKEYAKWGRETHPVVNVTWNDAAAYCNWAGGKLPTEAQWERAARGTDGRIYPWGNEWDASRCNSNSSGTIPVGSFPSGASPCGCMDMAGNVWEWCSDWYGEDYYGNSPSRNPGGPGSRNYRVLRGGSWDCADAVGFRCAFRLRNTPGDRGSNCGFRVCRASTTP
ncbi:MAG: SUMF1/EgtB/PvdO family nonheme iron enzyme [Candidatus Xenobiia bacterium LiM19]